MDFNFKYYGNYNVESFESKLSQLDWEYYTFRQDSRKGQENTKTAPLIWDLETDFRKVTKWKDYEFFQNELSDLEEYLIQIFGKGVIGTAVLINLPAGEKILEHTDSGLSFFKNTYRLHIPVQTNDKCYFTVGGETINMKKGELWEINNYEKKHSVDNDGDTDRVHLLIDYLRTEKGLL